MKAKWTEVFYCVLSVVGLTAWVLSFFFACP